VGTAHQTMEEQGAKCQRDKGAEQAAYALLSRASADASLAPYFSAVRRPEPMKMGGGLSSVLGKVPVILERLSKITFNQSLG